MSKSAEVAETGVVEKGWTDNVRLAERPALIHLGRFIAVRSVEVMHRDVSRAAGAVVFVPREAPIDLGLGVELVIDAAVQIVEIRAGWRVVGIVTGRPGGVVSAGHIGIRPGIDREDLLSYGVDPVERNLVIRKRIADPGAVCKLTGGGWIVNRHAQASEREVPVLHVLVGNCPEGLKIADLLDDLVPAEKEERFIAAVVDLRKHNRSSDVGFRIQKKKAVMPLGNPTTGCEKVLWSKKLRCCI